MNDYDYISMLVISHEEKIKLLEFENRQLKDRLQKLEDKARSSQQG